MGNRVLLFNNVSNIITNVSTDLTFPDHTTLSVYDLIVRNAQTGSNVAVTIVTSDYSALTSDSVIICNNSTSMTVDLMAATGSGHKLEIKNVNNTGSVTIDADVAGGTIDDELTQSIDPYDNLSIIDYTTDKWAIL